MPLLKSQSGHYVRKWRIGQLMDIGVVQEYKENLLFINDLSSQEKDIYCKKFLFLLGPKWLEYPPIGPQEDSELPSSPPVHAYK